MGRTVQRTIEWKDKDWEPAAKAGLSMAKAISGLKATAPSES